MLCNLIKSLGTIKGMKLYIDWKETYKECVSPRTSFFSKIPKTNLNLFLFSHEITSKTSSSFGIFKFR